MALAGTTWTINSDVDFYIEYMNASAFYSSSFTFSSNGNTYSSTSYTLGKPMGMRYDSTVVWASNAWVDEVYRTIEIISVSSGEAGLETWLNANAVEVVPVDYLTTDVEITSIADAIRSKGGTSASLVYPTGFVSAINAISTGTDVSDTTAAASDVRTGKYFYTSAGVKTQGSLANGSATTPATTITANPSISVSNSGLITATTSASQSVTPTVSAGYVSSGTAGTITVSGSNTQQLTAGTITNNTSGGTSSGTINRGNQIKIGKGFYANDAYYTAQANSGTKTISASGDTSVDGYATASVAAGSTTQNAPTVNSSGLVTATATVTAGYQGASTKSNTLQLTSQAAQTIHPSATDQTIASGKYLTGTQTVKGVLLTNLDAGNIKKDVVVKVGDSTDDDCVTSVTGTYEGGGGGGVDEFIANHGTMTEYTGTASIIGAGAFAWCANLVSASFPNCESIGNNAFQDSAKLLSVDFPLCSYIGNSAFQNCKSLVTINFPNCESVNQFAFYNCASIVMASFSMCKYIGSSAFYNCSSLTTAYFPSCTAIHSNAFYGCKRLTDVTFTNCKTLYSYAFNACSSLATVSLPNCSTINGQVFSKCFNLLSLYLLGSYVAKLSNTNAFYSTPISNYTTSTGGVYGSIYVPASLYNTYKTSTNWITYSDRFVSV